MKNGDLEARNELILRNMRLVAHVAKKYQASEEEQAEIDINFGKLLNTLQEYKVYLKYKFITPFSFTLISSFLISCLFKSNFLVLVGSGLKTLPLT